MRLYVVLPGFLGATEPDGQVRQMMGECLGAAEGDADSESKPPIADQDLSLIVAQVRDALPQANLDRIASITKAGSPASLGQVHWP